MGLCQLMDAPPLWMFLLMDQRQTHGLIACNENSTGPYILTGLIDMYTLSLHLQNGRRLCHKRVIASERVLALSPYDKQAYQLVKHIYLETKEVDNKTFMYSGLGQLEQAGLIDHATAKVCRAMVAEYTSISPPERCLHLSRADLEAARPPAADLAAFLRAPILGPSAAEPSATRRQSPPRSQKPPRRRPAIMVDPEKIPLWIGEGTPSSSLSKRRPACKPGTRIA